MPPSKGLEIAEIAIGIAIGIIGFFLKWTWWEGIVVWFLLIIYLEINSIRQEGVKQEKNVKI